MASAQARSPISLDRPVGEDGDTVANVSGQQDVNLSRVLERQALRQLMKGMPAEDRSLLDEYFLQGHTQHEIADRRDVSQMQISRSLARILRRLRARAAAE